VTSGQGSLKAIEQFAKMSRDMMRFHACDGGTEYLQNLAELVYTWAITRWSRLYNKGCKR